MAKFQINLVELTRNIFNLKGYIPLIGGLPQPDIKFEDIPTIEINEVTETSVLGTPIFETTRLFNNNDDGEEVILLDVPIIEVRYRKNIVKTAVQGRPGTVKELINDDDKIVTIRGLLVNDNSEKPPIEKLKVLHDVVLLPFELGVENTLLNQIFGIDNLVIESADYPKAVGFTNVQPYVLNCVSDDAIELKIDQDL